jgi:predicted amidohydrolase
MMAHVRGPLSVAVAQTMCVALDVAGNALQHAQAVRTADARVVVFPELSLTGYELDAPAVTTDDQRLAPIVEACAETRSIALVGAPLQGRAGHAHIAMLAIDANGVRLAYRKVWVDESEARFSPGDAPAVLEIDGWRLGLAICKDTRMPQHWADTAALGIDAYVAGLVMHDHETDTQKERGRCIATTHRVWVAFASFAGPTGGGYARTAGCSAVWAPGGDILAQAGPEPGAIARATLY